MEHTALICDQVPRFHVDFFWFPVPRLLRTYLQRNNILDSGPLLGLCTRQTQRDGVFCIGIFVSGVIPRLLRQGLHIHECVHAAQAFLPVLQRSKRLKVSSREASAEIATAFSCSMEQWLRAVADSRTISSRDLARPVIRCWNTIMRLDK